MDKLNPEALAESSDEELNERHGVQPVDEGMILAYVLDRNELPAVSARPFSTWLYDEWNEFNEGGDMTNGDIVQSALHSWRGGK